MRRRRRVLLVHTMRGLHWIIPWRSVIGIHILNERNVQSQESERM